MKRSSGTQTLHIAKAADEVVELGLRFLILGLQILRTRASAITHIHCGTSSYLAFLLPLVPLRLNTLNLAFKVFRLDVNLTKPK